MHNYTPEDLICYLYKETTTAENAAIEEALESDWTLREKLNVLKASFERLNTLVQAPRTEAVLNVLKYARSGEIINAQP